jgi:hypothetical protein
MHAAPQDGLIAVVKRDCPTCELTAPVLGELARQVGLQVYTQDDPTFPETVPGRIDDTDLDVSHRLKIEIVPTLIRMRYGREVTAPMAGTGVSGSGSPASPGSAPRCPTPGRVAAPRTSSRGSSSG